MPLPLIASPSRSQLWIEPNGQIHEFDDQTHGHWAVERAGKAYYKPTKGEEVADGWKDDYDVREEAQNQLLDDGWIRMGFFLRGHSAVVYWEKATPMTPKDMAQAQKWIQEHPEWGQAQGIDIQDPHMATVPLADFLQANKPSELRAFKAAAGPVPVPAGLTSKVVEAVMRTLRGFGDRVLREWSTTLAMQGGGTSVVGESRELLQVRLEFEDALFNNHGFRGAYVEPGQHPVITLRFSGRLPADELVHQLEGLEGRYMRGAITHELAHAYDYLPDHIQTFNPNVDREGYYNSEQEVAAYATQLWHYVVTNAAYFGSLSASSWLKQTGEKGLWSLVSDALGAYRGGALQRYGNAATRRRILQVAFRALQEAQEMVSTKKTGSAQVLADAGITKADLQRVRPILREWVAGGYTDGPDLMRLLEKHKDVLAKFRMRKPVRLWRNERAQILTPGGQDVTGPSNRGWEDQYTRPTAWSATRHHAETYAFGNGRRLVTALVPPEDTYCYIPNVDAAARELGMKTFDPMKQDEVIVRPNPSFLDQIRPKVQWNEEAQIRRDYELAMLEHWLPQLQAKRDAGEQRLISEEEMKRRIKHLAQEKEIHDLRDELLQLQRGKAARRVAGLLQPTFDVQVALALRPKTARELLPYAAKRLYAEDVLVTLDVAKVEASWSKDKTFYVAPGGEGAIKGRYERFQQWLADNPGVPIQAPDIGLTPSGEIIFGDGRSRFAVLRDMGAERIAATVPKTDFQAMAERFGAERVSGTTVMASNKQAAPIPIPAGLPERLASELLGSLRAAALATDNDTWEIYRTSGHLAMRDAVQSAGAIPTVVGVSLDATKLFQAEAGHTDVPVVLAVSNGQSDTVPFVRGAWMLARPMSLLVLTTALTREEAMALGAETCPPGLQVLRKDLVDSLVHELAHLVNALKQGPDQFQDRSNQRTRPLNLTHPLEVKAISTDLCHDFEVRLGATPGLTVQEFLDDETNWQWRQIRSQLPEAGRRRIIRDLTSIRTRESNADVRRASTVWAGAPSPQHRIYGLKVARALYHGTSLERARLIQRDGLEPQVGDLVQQAYGDDAESVGYDFEPLVFAGDKEALQRGVYSAMLHAIQADGHDITDAEQAIRNWGALVVLKDGDEVMEHRPAEDDPYGYTDHPLQVETGDYYSRDGLVPDHILTGPALVRYLTRNGVNLSRWTKPFSEQKRNALIGMVRRTHPDVPVEKVIEKVDGLTFEQFHKSWDYYTKLEKGKVAAAHFEAPSYEDMKWVGCSPRLYERAKKRLESLQFPLTLYRAVKIPSEAELWHDQVGIYWTDKLPNARFYTPAGRDAKGHKYVLRTQVTPEMIDWPRTMSANCEPQGHTGTREQEIKLRHGVNVVINGILGPNDTEFQPRSLAVTAALTKGDIEGRRRALEAFFPAELVQAAIDEAPDTYTMPKDEAVAEHERLIEVLRSPDHADDLREADEQAGELKKIKAATTPTIGFNVNDSEMPWTEMILAGKKTIETRDSDSLRPHVGERVGIVRTGGRGPAALVGYCTLGEPKIYRTNEEFRADNTAHQIPAGPQWDLQPGAVKFGYPLSDVEACEPKRVEGQGRVFRRIAAPQGDAFQAWFRDSKVVDDAGDPLEVIHQTDAQFTTFLRKHLGKNTLGNASDKWYAQTSKIGFWFASPASTQMHTLPGDTQMRVYLSLQNPYVCPTLEHLATTLDWERMSGEQFRRAMIAKGYDGVIVQADHEVDGTSYVAFHANQIKSVDNAGAFNPKKRDIMASSPIRSVLFRRQAHPTHWPSAWISPTGEVHMCETHEDFAGVRKHPLEGWDAVEALKRDGWIRFGAYEGETYIDCDVFTQVGLVWVQRALYAHPKFTGAEVTISTRRGDFMVDMAEFQALNQVTELSRHKRAKTAAFFTEDELRARAREEEERTGKTSEQLLEETVAQQNATCTDCGGPTRNCKCAAFIHAKNALCHDCWQKTRATAEVAR